LDLSTKVVKLLLKELVLPSALVQFLGGFLGVIMVGITVRESLREL
jgi:hypothetical protein